MTTTTKISIPKTISRGISKKKAKETISKVPLLPAKTRTIGDILSEIGEKEAPTAVIEALRTLDPHFRTEGKKYTFKYITLLCAYYQAAFGDRSARDFIAERTEGKVQERDLSEGKGDILKAIETLMDNPIDRKAS